MEWIFSHIDHGDYHSIQITCTSQYIARGGVGVAQRRILDMLPYDFGYYFGHLLRDRIDNLAAEAATEER